MGIGFALSVAGGAGKHNEMRVVPWNSHVGRVGDSQCARKVSNDRSSIPLILIPSLVSGPGLNSRFLVPELRIGLRGQDVKKNLDEHVAGPQQLWPGRIVAQPKRIF